MMSQNYTPMNCTEDTIEQDKSQRKYRDLILYTVNSFFNCTKQEFFHTMFFN